MNQDAAALDGTFGVLLDEGTLYLWSHFLIPSYRIPANHRSVRGYGNSRKEFYC